VFFTEVSKQTKKAFLYLPSYIFLILIAIDQHETIFFVHKK